LENIGKKVFIKYYYTNIDYKYLPGIIKSIDSETGYDDEYEIWFDKPIHGNTFGEYDRGWYPLRDIIFGKQRKEKLERLIAND